MKKIRKVKFIFVSSFIVAIFLAGLTGYLFGNRNFALTEKSFPSFVKRDLGEPKDTDFSLFWEAYSKLKENYIGKIDGQKFLYGAIYGAYASLDDPYTVFLDPEVSKDFEDELSGALEGIGIKIGMLDGYPAVIAPLNDSPAQKAGLRPKDKILKVDDLDTKDLPLDEVVSKIRGKEGTMVKLSVLRDGEDKVRDFELKREKITIKTVEVKYVNDVAVVQLNEFGISTRKDFTKIANEISTKGVTKMILDLRDNPGGLLDGAIDVGGEIFAKDTTIVIEEGKISKDELKTSGPATLKQIKLVVLVNGGSASASEILAGAIKDNKRGKIIGEKTFGKGTVQQFDQLSDGSSTKITVSRWLTPNGTSIDKNGIIPDIEVKEGDNPLFDLNDPLLQRALSEITK